MQLSTQNTHLPIYKFISHAGNTKGPNLYKENTTDHIISAINEGFNVMIDIWSDPRDPNLYLGTESPRVKINEEFFDLFFYRFKDILWLNCKNIFTLEAMMKFNDEKNNFNCFIRSRDQVVLTTKGYVWNYSPFMINNSIAAFPETHIKPEEYYLDYKNLFKNPDVVGVCSDYVDDIRRMSWEL